MSGALDVLVVDDRPESVRPLAEFLTQRCRHVEVVTSVKEALAAITKRKVAGDGFQLILSDFVMPKADGLSFLRELRLRSDATPFVFITGFRSLNPTLEIEAKRLGVLAILDKPIQLGEVECLLEQTTSTFQRMQGQNAGEQPFFGTSRIMRRSAASASVPPQEPSQALEPRHPAAPAPAPEPAALPGTATWPVPSEALEPLQPEALRPQPAVSPQPVVLDLNQHRPSASMQVGSTTTRFHSGVSPTVTAASGTGRVSHELAQQPSTSFTARVRRGVEGTDSFSRPPGDGSGVESGREFVCVSCRRSFLVLVKPMTYTTVCVHCGQLQRIEP
jgi:CheY-like chemotaxis protein